jgi:hypothetical protein
LASVVAQSGSTDWRALLVTRADSGGDSPKCQVLTVVGDPTTAAALLDVAAEFRVAALRSAVPLFEETSRLFHTNRFVDEDKLFGNDFKQGDLGDDDTGFVWGSSTMADVLACEPSFGDLADLLWGAIACVVKPHEVKAGKDGAAS